jgi:hypothetical protein
MIEELVVGVEELGVAERLDGGVTDREMVGVVPVTRGEAVAGWGWGKNEKKIRAKVKSPNETEVSVMINLVGNWGF